MTTSAPTRLSEITSVTFDPFLDERFEKEHDLLLVCLGKPGGVFANSARVSDFFFFEDAKERGEALNQVRTILQVKIKMRDRLSTVLNRIKVKWEGQPLPDPSDKLTLEHYLINKMVQCPDKRFPSTLQHPLYWMTKIAKYRSKLLHDFLWDGEDSENENEKENEKAN